MILFSLFCVPHQSVHYNYQNCLLLKFTMKQQILQALNLSLVPDSQSAKAATEALSTLAHNPGYCINLMEIVDDQSMQIFIRQAALAQLKNSLRKYWNAQHYQISNQQKCQIINALLTAFIRSASQKLLVKLYREVVVAIMSFQYQTCIPVNTILEKIKRNEDIPLILQFVLAISQNFQFTINEEEKVHCCQFFMTVLPHLFELVQRNPDSEVIYLVIKIIWKIVHYDVSDEIRKSISNGMDIIIAIARAVNPQFQNDFDEFQDKKTPQFYYFHTKKWATRILYRYIYRHANATPTIVMSPETKQLNIEFSKMWYDAYGQKVVEAITSQFGVPATKKIRYYQLKCLEGLINNHPNVMRPYSEDFQYNILLHYMKLNAQDQQIANSDPLQFINRQENPTLNFTSLKAAATQAWLAFTNLGSQKKGKGKKGSSVGSLFYENMNFIKSKLEGNNMVEKQMAMFLICQLRWLIYNSEQIRKILPSLISTYVITEFTNQIMFLRARAVEIFNKYGDLSYSPDVIKKAVEGIYFCLTGDNYPLVRIKAAMAFHVLFRHQQAKELVKPLFQQILQVYLQLIQKYDCESLVYSLSSIVEHFSTQIGSCAFDLVKYLSRHFIKLYHRDNEQSQLESYDGETELAAAGILNTIKIIIQSPIEVQTVEKMEDDILPICEFLFCADDCDYIEDVLTVLRAYSHRVNSITENLMFFYVLSIYYVTGIPKQYWPAIPNLSISDEKKKALSNIKMGCNIESIDSVMPFIRNFISKDSSLLFRVNDMFGNNLVQLLFKMTNQIYQKGPDVFDGEVQMNCCTILMIYLVENNIGKWNQMIINNIWTIAKHNLLKCKSTILKSLTAQLVCVLLWNCAQHIVVQAHHDGVLNQMFTFIINSQKKIKQEHERQRIILGISELLKIDEKPNQLFEYCQKLFVIGTNFIKKNAELRLDQSASQNYFTESEEEDEQNMKYHDHEPEDIWQQDYQNNYSDRIDEIDEIKLFKESMAIIQTKNPSFYGNLMQLVPQDELINLQTLMQKAIDTYVKE